MIQLVKWILIYPTVAFFVLGYALIISYLTYCSIIRTWSDLPKAVKILLLPLSPLYFVDVLFNVTFGTLMFVEWPKTLTFTRRCDSHLLDTDWRGIEARYICRILNLFSPNHCIAKG